MADHRSSNHLPLHLRRDSDSRHKDPIGEKAAVPGSVDASRRRFPESLQLAPSSFRLRSETASTRSSISSATAYSYSTLASPISTSYASDAGEIVSVHALDASRPSSRLLHRCEPSTGTCSTHSEEDDDDDAVIVYPDLSSKLEDVHVATPIPGNDNERMTHNESCPSTDKGDENLTSHDSPESSYSDPSGEPVADPQWEASSATSDDFSPEDAEAILDYTLQLVYGVDLVETSKTTPALQRLVCKFVGDVGQCIWERPSDGELTQATSTPSSSSTPSQGGSGGGSQGGNKRKKKSRGDDDEGEFSDGESSGFLPIKRQRPSPRDDENLRLSCPFRRRNPQRFNVRDHHSCAMTFFPKFAELRQHIVKHHKRDDPSAFVCDRCNRDFRTRKQLRDHQRLPKELMCDIADHDPESGVDGTTSNKLLSRKRVSGASPEGQWKEIWNILFPDDEDHQIQPYHFTPVIEHFELSSHYLASFEALQDSLRDKISNPFTLETLSTKFQQCFIEAVERCIAVAQNMPYVNRSNKKTEPSRVQSFPNFVPSKGREVFPRPDSGVAMMDECSEEGGSVGNSGLCPRDSVRTVVKAPRRGTNIASDAIGETLSATRPTASTVFDQDLMAQLGSMPPMDFNAASMNPSAVHAWSHGLLYTHHGGFSMADQFGNLTPQADVSNWADYYQANLNGMNGRFSDFGGGQVE